MSVSGAIAFAILFGAGVVTAMVLYFGMRAVKLI